MRAKKFTTKNSGFTRDNALILKGIFTLFLLYHHLFLNDIIDKRNIDICIKNVEVYRNLVLYGRVCVQGFAFISAFGITQQLMNASQEIPSKSAINIVIRRLLKLEASCIFIYCIAIFYKRFIIHNSIREAYLDESGIFRPIYLLLDAVGLADFFGTPLNNITWWYLSYAILIIFLVPAIYLIYEKLGIWCIPLVLLVKPEVLSVFLGVAFAKWNGFDKLELAVSKNLKNKIISMLFCIFLLFFSYELVAGRKQIDEIQGWVCVVWAYIVIVYISKIPIISTLLKEIGKHSGNIFLTHTFIYFYFYGAFVYSFKKDYLIFGVLLAISIGVSFVLEVIKKITRYNSLVEKLINKILIVNNKMGNNFSECNSSVIR